jgi:hypothetical protein
MSILYYRTGIEKVAVLINGEMRRQGDLVKGRLSDRETWCGMPWAAFALNPKSPCPSGGGML